MSLSRNPGCPEGPPPPPSRCPALHVLALAVLLASCVQHPSGTGAGPWAEGQERQGRLVRLSDACNLIVETGGTREQVRLNGVACPAYEDEWGPDAASFVMGFSFGRTLRLEIDRQERDWDGSLLASVWSEQILLNEALVLEGLALPSAAPPNTRHAERLDRASAVARESGAGFWHDGGMYLLPDESGNPPNIL